MKKLVSFLLILVLCLTVVVSCSDKVSQGLKDAQTYLNNLYQDKATETPSDYKVVGKIIIGKDTYTVEWSVSATEGVKVVPGDDGMVTIDVDEKAANDIEYVLKATIKDAKGKTVTSQFNRKVPKYKVNTWQEYVDAKVDSTVVVQGVITAIHSKTLGSQDNSIFVQDMNGGGAYYVYKMDEDPGAADSKLKVGTTVEVKGKRADYSGTHEIIEATFEVIKEEPTVVNPVDFTEIYKNATALGDAALTDLQALLVTIKGVEITGQDADNGYYKFKLGALESYIRISSSNNAVAKADLDTIRNTHTEKFGYLADVTGIIAIYNGNFYLQPVSVDVFSNFRLPERTDAEKVELEAGNTKLPERIEDDSTITLPTPSDAYKDVVTFAWESDNACAVIADGKLTITLPETNTDVKITLTVTCGEVTETKEFTIKVSAASTDNYLPVDVETPVKDTAYKFYLAQNKRGETLYFAGAINDRNFLVTTTKAANATDVYLEEVEGGFRLYFKDGETKKYIDAYVYNTEENKAGLQIVTEPTCVWVFDADLGVLTATLSGKTWYLGTYSNYDTMSLSETWRISGEKEGDVGVSQFPAYLATLTPADYAPVDVETPVKDTAYKFYLAQNKRGEILYFAGAINDRNFLVTTTKAANATDVYLEEVEGGFRLYFKDGETKKYIDAYVYNTEENKAGLQIVTEPTCVWVFDADLGVLTATLSGKTWYLGTYSNYDTMSLSETWRISGEKEGDVGVSQFPAYLATLKLKKIAPANVEEPKKDTAYKFYLAQNKRGETLYFAGAINDRNFLVTTDKISRATDVYLEEVEGGFRLYFKDGETKKYIDAYVYNTEENKAGLQIVTEPTCVWVFDADLGVLTATLSGKTWYLGTYSNYDTMSLSETWRISGEKEGDVGVSQFPAYLATIEFVKAAE